MELQQALSDRSEELARKGGILDRARVYLSGPMDFVASREEEKRSGWRVRVSEFLLGKGTTVFDPWNKPEVSGLKHYGKEDEFTTSRRDHWTYDTTEDGRRMRDSLCDEFWPTLHIDLRMTDLADFLVAYCPTNIYSVGTVHEIATARLQHKPVLLVTPKIDVDTSAAALRAHLTEKGDAEALDLLQRMDAESPRRSNLDAAPSLWYMAMVEHEDYFFDGFGFDLFREEMGWTEVTAIDQRERADPPKRPLLPYLDKLDREIPKRFSAELNREIENPEWLIFATDDATLRAPRVETTGE